MLLLEIEAQKNVLELQNAKLVDAMAEKEHVLQQFNRLFDQAPVGGVILGQDGIIRTVNHIAAHMLGEERSRLVGRPLEQFLSEGSRPVFAEFLRNMMSACKASCELEQPIGGNPSLIRFEGACDTCGDECRVAMIDITGRHIPEEERAPGAGGHRKLRWYELSGKPPPPDREDSREIERSKREEGLVDSLKKQRRLSFHLMSAREEERTAVAREIHEELGQMLAALQLNVSLVTKEYLDHAKLVARTQAMEQLITSSIMTVNRISSELRPVMLDILGLADAIEWQAKEFEKKSGIRCKTTILLAEKKVDRDVSTAVYRIVQEALSNVARHATADHVRVTLVEKVGRVTLSVSDNGRGITEREKNNPQSLGIAGMRERAEAFGGRLRICGSSRQGTTVVARIPLAREGDVDEHQDTCSR
ncbi:PAS/PAC sensor signal transduction histidine kinase [Geobacter metallireducens RCH3]|nr:ATP-binding protein [Geobacter metallireducens]EHP86722.1 PAS/PAC sensor signal transduction histidine kinase [Geobacter metallireducens RCH3]